MNKNRKILITCIRLVFIVLCFALIITSCLSGKRKAFPPVSTHLSPLPVSRGAAEINHPATLKIMTLNIAHGRKDGMNQLFQSSQRIRHNLGDIALVFRRENPDLIAIQEADGPSAWSGNFSHVAYIAEKSGYPYSVRGAHVNGMMLSYGTALLSKYPLEKPVSVTFEPSPPTFSKGFVSAVFHMSDETDIRFISVHLDFLRESVREQQARDMIETLSGSSNPLIVMGDFNCEWEEASAVQMLAEELKLSAYRMEAENMATFPALERRIDWILISREFEFVSYRVIPDIVSDHLGVIAEVRKRD